MNTQANKKKNLIFLVWLMPIIALVISISMMYKSYTNKGTQITIYFKDASGFEKIKTAIKYKGIRVGYVKSVSVDPNNINRFKIVAMINKADVNYIVKKGTKFWKKSVKITKNGISGLSTIIKGNHIELMPISTDSKVLKNIPSQYVFQALDTPPIEPNLITNGKNLILEANQTYNITKGDKIYFKGFEAGIVNDVTFDTQKEIAKFNISISKKFANKIDTNTKFYINNAIDLEFNAKKFSLKVAPLEEIILNSISFTNLNKKINSSSNKKTYKLYSSFNKINFDKNITIITLISNNLNSIKIGTSIIYKGLKIGEIVNIKYNKIHDNFKFFASINNDFLNKINKSSYFIINSGIDMKIGLNGIKIKSNSLEDIVFGGIKLVNLGHNTKYKRVFWLNTSDEFDNIKENKEYITIYLAMLDTNKLQKGADIIYKGFKIGYLKDIKLNDKFIVAILKIHKKYKYLIKKDTKFWLEKFKANLTQGIQNPKSAISGPTIHILPNKHSKENFYTHFNLENKHISKTVYKDGLRIILQAGMKSTLNVDSSIYYRQVKIGNIEDIDLNSSGNSVIIKCFIEPRYAKFIRKNSKFFLSTAIASEVSLFDVKIQTGTFESMINGTITVVTPPNYGIKAKNNDKFKMYQKPKEEWIKWNTKIDEQ